VTSLAHRAHPRGATNGGMAARRAVIRWALRLFRREWRQQLLVLGLLAVAVAAATACITIVHDAALADRSRFGSADTLLAFDGSDSQKLDAGLDAARKAFGTVDVVGHRTAAVPGSVETVDYRAQNPRGTYARVGLDRGNYPVGPDEVAVTDGIAESLRLHLGSTLALDGRRRTVVGIVENSRKLSDEFALVTPSSGGAPDYVTALVATDAASRATFFGRGPRPAPPPAFTSAESWGIDHPETEPLLLVAVTTVFLLLASLVAAAGFAVVAQRRLRQLGMLAAIGATEKHVRLVLVANGAIVGALAALVGTAAGLAAWAALAPTLEPAVDHRIDRLDVPWWLVAATIVLAVLGATAAAWWPARTASRLPVVLALSGRPPRPRPARHSALAAAVLIAVGVACLALSNRDRVPLIVAGIVAAILGGLLLGPLAIRLFSRLAAHLSIAPRLALRDLVRYQARSGAALAAVTLALGIVAAVVVVASAEAAKDAAAPPTLSDRQIRVYLGSGPGRVFTPLEAAARLPRLAASVRQLAAQLGDATVLPLTKARQLGAPPGAIENERFFFPIEFLRRLGRLSQPEGQVYVATPAVLDYLGIDPSLVDPGADFLVDRSVQLDGITFSSALSKSAAPANVERVERIEVGDHLFGTDSARTPPSFITLAGLRRHGWAQIPSGWLVESRRSLTGAEIDAARRVAADAGLTVEVDHGAPTNGTLMAIAIAAGGILALAILAMTVGLIRSEGAGDLRTLTATGATSRIRRTLTATTAGALALLGALLGVAGAYVILAATYHDDLGYLRHVPVVHLAVVVAGVPLAAAAAGWLVAGREPPAIARRAVD
jgi:putative ABC transport system permease protein